jgi:hypothetical protein
MLHVHVYEAFACSYMKVDQRGGSINSNQCGRHGTARFRRLSAQVIDQVSELLGRADSAIACIYHETSLAQESNQAQAELARELHRET